MAVPILAAVKAAAKQAISNKDRRTGFSKRMEKLESLGRAVKDIKTAAMDAFDASKSPTLNEDVSVTSGVDWEHHPDFSGWNVRQVDEFFNEVNNDGEGG